ncbi:hypothetical protein AWJ20_3349 [Sugiyamaella lignohabitans]|uniref:Type 1 phosphatases regulator YPI1 n=1 Tax=Sugiyamaella lignohabitans TaxID=796027 RepID=A0A161HHW4_9ASCO|nr:uncharacterized protein AWJ20_3349 [Sugiyamaella lignohabitans]ANB15710.1 hypothetical protein AWJ20_3349 [Sugiyamaella lignohabitans]
MSARQQAPAVAGSSSRTEVTNVTSVPVTLTLRGEGVSSRRQVSWTDDVIDNEHMNKKKSKSKYHSVIHS